LADKNQNDPVTFGYHLKGYGGFLSGGAGYVLSKESLQRLGSKLITNQKYCPNTGIEDVDVGQCLRSLGVFPSNSTDILGRERFHSSALKNHYMNIGLNLNGYSANPYRSVIYFFKGI